MSTDHQFNAGVNRSVQAVRSASRGEFRTSSRAFWTAFGIQRRTPQRVQAVINALVRQGISVSVASGAPVGQEALDADVIILRSTATSPVAKAPLRPQSVTSATQAEQVQCPQCGTQMPLTTQFCPGCGLARTHVRQAIEQRSRETGVPYNTLLDQVKAGQSLPARRRGASCWLMVIGAVLGSCMLLGVVGALVTDGQPQQSAQPVAPARATSTSVPRPVATSRVVTRVPTRAPTRPVQFADPAGATAKCNDGTYSYSQHRSGTCSQHGGVMYWINRPSS